VHLVEGSGAELSGEVAVLLRTRLRAAALLFFAAFATFFVWHTVILDVSTWMAVTLYAAHLTTTIVLGTIGVSLCSHCRLTASQLRWTELLTFGVPVAFFALMQYVRTTQWVDLYHVYPPLAAAWLLPIFTYCIFIPNTWRRAAVVIGLMAAVPVIMTAVMACSQPACSALLLGQYHVIVETVLVMTIAGGGGVWGVYIINSLRTEAFQARQMGQYKLKQLLGSGGMGDVYLAEHQLMKRPCAIKVIRPEKAGDPKVLARFEREVQATAKLSHWNTVDIFDYGRTDDGMFYYVMEYLPGMNLSELVKRFGPLPASRSIYLMRQACDALQEAHDVGLIHRDLKPVNIFAAVRGGVYDVSKLLDFGLAKPLADFDTAQLTQEGSITGSPLYMSPEQATGDREPDARSDIYCLGAVFYYILTGHPPFENDKPLKVLISHAHEMPQPPSHWRPELSEEIDMIVMRCLQKNPDDRYQSATELATALADCEEANDWTRADAKRWWHQNDYRYQAEPNATERKTSQAAELAAR
jgi:serine/threonine-protein kinase